MRRSLKLAVVSTLAAVDFLMLAALPVFAEGEAGVIDACRYANDAAAQEAWRPTGGGAPVTTVTLDGRKALRLPCNFAGTTIERASWDRKVKLDLAPCQGIQFKVFCNNPAPISHFTLYFQSGGGWYSAAFFPEAAGWSTVTINKASTESEGTPAGWGRIETIRISAWRGRNEDTELGLSDLRMTGVLGVDASIAVVRGTSLARSRSGESKSSGQSAEAITRNLSALGIGCSMISDFDLTAKRLTGAKLVILPHNPSMPDDAANALIKFLNSGGKLLAFYGLPAKLRSVVKIESGAYITAKHPGYFSTIRFADGALSGAPKLIGQRSWNVIEATPVPGASRALAEWLDDKGQPTGHAAVVASDNCIVMTHVLLNDDAIRKRQMLLAMAGHLDPDLWRQTANARIARIGRIAGCKTFDEAASLIAKTAKDDHKVEAVLESARKLRDEAVTLGVKGDYVEASERAAAATQRLSEAFCTAQQPRAGEFRAFWCHNAFGVDGMEWDEAIRRLADNGFTAIFPNMLWGGVAFYDSKLLPVARDAAEKGDQIAKCLAACKKYGVQIHVWKVNWNTGHRVSAEFIERMRREGRLQANSKGKQEPWLCPSHVENQKLEIASMVEVARDYDVDGIQFDYIRYPDGDHCFCDGCRERFAKAVGVKIKNWPKDALSNGPLRSQWLEWRRSNITTIVKAVSEQARLAKPKIKISAAVFPNWAIDRDGVGQDWKLWCDKGWLDFVCPMDYTQSDRQFDDWIATQKDWAGKTPVYPGIGVSSSGTQLGVDRAIGQIAITRRHDTNGFIIFNYGVTEARDLVPLLGLGITAKR